MEPVPVTGLEELELHLEVVLEAPETPLNAKLFDEVELQLNGMLCCWRRPVATKRRHCLHSQMF